jgi:hypothetical protein
MLRLLTTPLACVFLVLLLAMGFGASPVQSYTTYTLSATDNGKYPTFSGFSLRYIDSIHVDGRFEIGELVEGSFTPVTFMSYGPYTKLQNVPAYDEAQSPYTDGEVGLPGNMEYYWVFWDEVHQYGLSYLQGDLAYTQTADPKPPVPIPPSVFLLGAGLIGLAVARRKKRLRQ